MTLKYLISIALITLLVRCNVTLHHQAPNDLFIINPKDSPYQPLMSESSWMRNTLMPFPQFRPLLDSLAKIQNLSEDGFSIYQRTLSTFKNYLFILNLTLETTYLHGDPMEDHLRSKQGIEDLKQNVADLKTSYFQIREESNNIPFHQLLDGTGKLYQEKCRHIRNLQDSYSICSIQREELTGKIDRAEQDNNATLREIKDLEQQLGYKTSSLRDNDAQQGKIKKELANHFDQIKINIQEISESYKVDFLNGKQKLSESSDNRVKEIDQLLSKLVLQAGELGSAQINHFIFVLDHSGSMLGEKWSQVLKAVKYFMDANRHQGLHEITIIIFGSSVHTHLKAQKFLEYTDPPEDIPWDLTNYDGAMEAVKNTIPLSKARPIVLFLTDGMPTTCDKALSTLDDIQKQYSERGLMLFGLGVGDFNHHVLLEVIKRANAGNEYFVNKNAQIPFLHTTQDQKVLYQIFLNVSAVAKKSGEEIDEKISWLQNEKRILMNETRNLIREIHDFYLQSAAEMSINDQTESKFVHELEQQLTLLLEKEKEIQAAIRGLHSKINSLAISPNGLKDLKESHTHKTQECQNIHEDLLKGRKEKEAFAGNQSHEIGVFIQKDLIDRGSNFFEERQKLINKMEPLLNHLDRKIYQISTSLSHANFSKIEKKILKYPNSYFSQAFNNPEDSCKDKSGCLKKILTEIFQNKEIDSHVPKPALLSKIADELLDLSPILVGQSEQNDLTIKSVRNWIKKEIITQRETSWSLASFLDWVGKNFLGIYQNFWIRVEGEALKNEEENLKKAFHTIGQEFREVYDKFIFGEWRKENEKIVQEFSKGLFDD